jgi:hypothetical protein
MKQLYRIAGVLLAALLIGVGAGYAFLSYAPCKWFGSAFEGACGYLGVQYSVLFGQLATVAFFSLFMCFTNLGGSAPAPAPRALNVSWIVLFALQWFDLFAASLRLGLDWIPLMLSQLLLGGFILVSLLLTPYRARHPGIVLLALVPVGGPLLLGSALFLGKQGAASLPQAAPD